MRDLPRLSTADLVARFGDDEPALRRYRMLSALLREGRAPGEVARTFGVSRESLRRLRNAYARTGLDAIQSRRRGGGHLARGSPLAAALRQELAADPGIPAHVLWRRVQARLRAIGQPAPRSTFYRILAHLRSEDVGAPPGRASIALLREALASLAEDPPLTLGRSGLAELLLPAPRDPLQRGRQLQRALHTAIAQLRPAEAGAVRDDPRWRHYLIIAGEYETGEKRAALQDALALSASTYSRAKREALERLVVLLTATLGDLPPPAPPADLISAPPPPDDFDYEAELNAYMARLRHSGLAIIWGPAGAGKSALAAMLAHRLKERGQKVVWVDCPPPESPTPAVRQLLVRLAAGLALDGRPELWDTLAAGEATPIDQRLELLADGLARRRWTVIIQNADGLASAEAGRVLDILTAAQERRDLRLVLVGRTLPPWADPARWPPLPFPSDAPARRAFLRRLDDQPEPTPELRLAGTLHDRVIALVSAIPIEAIESLSEAQIAQVLAALRPVEELAAELRAAVRAASQPGGPDPGKNASTKP
jgi:hypothetical protein